MYVYIQRYRPGMTVGSRIKNIRACTLCVDIYIYTHTDMHTDIHTYLNAYIHTYIHTYMYTRLLFQDILRACVCIHMYTHVYIYIYTCAGVWDIHIHETMKRNINVKIDNDIDI